MSYKYVRIISEKLVSKAERRTDTSRRVFVRPKELYSIYDKYNADYEIKRQIGEAAREMMSRGQITVDYIERSDDILRIALVDEALDDIRAFLRDEYGIEPMDEVRQRAENLIQSYEKKLGTIAKSYFNELRDAFSRPGVKPDLEFIDDVLKMIVFLVGNNDDIYVREASMIVYGDSKYFEEVTYREVCRALYGLHSSTDVECKNNNIVAEIEDVNSEGLKTNLSLETYHVHHGEQEIRIAGKWLLKFGGSQIDVSSVAGGISISTSALDSIEYIGVGDLVMTVENKTAFERLSGRFSCMGSGQESTSGYHDDREYGYGQESLTSRQDVQGYVDGQGKEWDLGIDVAYMYLGGFASSGQVEFLQMVRKMNPDVTYKHFGDIDVGGLLIHRNLCEVTGIEFFMFCMGVKELSDERFSNCLKELTDNDRSRLESLDGDQRYEDVVRYMKEHGVKLEQEIVAYLALSSYYEKYQIDLTR